VRINIKRLQQLKRKLTKEKDLSKIWLFYMDHFADHQEFIDLGEPTQDDYLNAVLRTICQQMFSKKATITDFLLISIAEYQFLHGPFQVQGCMGGVIYFKDIKTGLVAVSTGFSPTDAVKYSRFSDPIPRLAPNRYELN
jgi:hypothetical protein